MNNYNQLHKPSLPFPVLNLITLPYLLLSFCSIKIKLPAIDNDVRVSKVTRVEEVGDEEGNGAASGLGLILLACCLMRLLCIKSGCCCCCLLTATQSGAITGKKHSRVCYVPSSSVGT